ESVAVSPSAAGAAPRVSSMSVSSSVRYGSQATFAPRTGFPPESRTRPDTVAAAAAGANTRRGRRAASRPNRRAIIDVLRKVTLFSFRENDATRREVTIPAAMDIPLAGKIALVTGGGVRVGRAISLSLAAAGADVSVHYRASRSEAETAAAEIGALERRAKVIQADLSRPEDCRRV